jgi:hypothetical protein
MELFFHGGKTAQKLWKGNKWAQLKVPEILAKHNLHSGVLKATRNPRRIVLNATMHRRGESWLLSSSSTNGWSGFRFGDIFQYISPAMFERLIDPPATPALRMRTTELLLPLFVTQFSNPVICSKHLFCNGKPIHRVCEDLLPLDFPN